MAQKHSRQKSIFLAFSGCNTGERDDIGPARSKGVGGFSLEELSRRGFIAGVAGMSLASTFWPVEALAAPVRSLAFVNTNTDESLKVDYWVQGSYIPESMTRIAYILRDHRNDKQRVMAPQLMDLLWAMRLRMASSSPFHVISAYRSPETNALMRKKSSGIGENSLHLTGQAIDLKVPGRDLKFVRNAALSLKMGGVGYYPGSGFVHLDIGKVRHW